MYTPGLDDEILMIVPFVLVPIQMYFITTIRKQTPFIIRESVSLPIPFPYQKITAYVFEIS